MRAATAIWAALLMVGVAAPAARADVMPVASGTTKPGCGCPGAVHRPVRHVRRHVRHYTRHVRRTVRYRVVEAPPAYWPPPPPPPEWYNTMIPSPLNPAYDRAMVLHFRSPPVSGEYLVNPGYPPTPAVIGIKPYRFPAYGGVYQYDGLTGQYIRLAQIDAVRALPLMPEPPPPPPPLPR